MEVGFSVIPNNIKNDVRKLEKITISIEKEKSNVMLNEQCVIYLCNKTCFFILKS